MDGPYLRQLPTFFTIGRAEKNNLLDTLRRPLSGYLGGIHHGGIWVKRLAEKWAEAFKVGYAIPCNSATSGLLAACMAAGIGPGDLVWTTAYSMSATAACAKVLGATIVFIDIETIRLSMNMNLFTGPKPKLIIVTNLFGHPAYLKNMRSWCDSNKVIMVEDNAQAPFASEDGRYTGTIGHMGVFSLNVHKHIQCGEGGVVVTDDEGYAAKIADAINHGELALNGLTGLNLRMTEPIAAIACAQLAKAPAIIRGRRDLGLELTDMVADYQRHIKPFVEDKGCVSVYYIWAALVADAGEFVDKMTERGFPVRWRYATPLPWVFDGNKSLHGFPVLKQIQQELVTFEVCAFDPNRSHLKKMRDIVRYVGDSLWDTPSEREMGAPTAVERF